MVLSASTRFPVRPGIPALVALLLLALAPAVAPAAAAPAHLVVQQVRAETRTSPPTFSWQLGSPVNGERQTAYRVLVASTDQRLKSGRPDVWDSGRITTGASAGVSYLGPALRPGQRYLWTVQVWDSRGRPSAWSSPQSLAVGPTDWQGAQWISPD